MKSSRGHDIICVDLDGTLCNEICFTIQEVEKATLNKKNAKIVEEYYLKNYVIIYSARRDELWPATLKWLRMNNIRYHAVSNLKIPASVYFDDKAHNPERIQRAFHTPRKDKRQRSRNDKSERNTHKGTRGKSKRAHQ